MALVDEASHNKNKSFKQWIKTISNGVINDIKTDVETKELVSECLVLSGALFASLITKYAVYLVVFLAALLIIKYRDVKSFYVMFFLLPFINIIRIKPSELYYSVYLWCLLLFILGVKLLYDIIKQRKKINYFFTIMCLVLAIYFILPIGPLNFTCHGAAFLTLAIIFISYYYANEFDFEKIVLFFGMGVLIASFLGLFRPLFSRAQSIIPYFADAGGRYTGVSNDPNYYSGDLLLLLSGGLILFTQKKLNYLFYPLLLLITIFCLKAQSKMTLIIFAILMIIFCIYWLIKNRNKKAVFQCLTMFLVVLCAMLICFNQVNSLYKRLTKDDSVVDLPNNFDSTSAGSSVDMNGGFYVDCNDYEINNNIFTTLTTGRTNIWIAYFEESTNSLKHILFGHGIGADFIYCHNGYKADFFAEHNTFVQMIYRLGIIGILLLLLTIISACNWKKIKRIKFSNLLSLIVILGLFMALCNLLSFRLSLYIIFVVQSVLMVEDIKCSAVSTEESVNEIINNNTSL